MAKKIIISAVIAVLMIIGIIALIYFIPSGSQQTVGSSTLGLQEVKYFKSSSECFDSSGQKLWMYTLRGGGLGQWAEGEVDPDDVQDQYSGDEVPQNSLKIDTKYDQECVYPLVKNNQATAIYTLSDPIDWYCLSASSSGASERCGGGDGYVYGYYSYPIFTCWCSKYIKKTGAIGSSPNFNNPDVHSIMDIEVEAKGEKSTKKFDTEGQIRGKVGNNVCAIWQGNLDSGEQCPLPQDDVRPAYINGEWELLSEDRYQDYKTEWSQLLSKLDGGIWTTKSEIVSGIDDVNYDSNRALNSRVSFGTIDQPTSQTNAKIVKELDHLIDYPVLTLYVRADWLGIVTPIPDPKIKELSSECFNSGREGRIKVVIKNEGEERGEVDVYADCEAGFDVMRKSVSISAGQERTVYLEITGTTDQTELKGKCTVFADAIENIDEAEVEVCVSGNVQCTKGEEWCEGGNYWHCPTGIQEEIKEDCKSKGQVCNYNADGKPFCADSDNWCQTHPEDPNCQGSECGYWFKAPVWLGGWGMPDLFCLINQWFMKFKIIFSVVLGFIGGLLSLLYTRKFTPSDLDKNKKWIIYLSVFVLIGASIGYLAFVYFWWILLAIFILAILKIFI